MNRNILMQKIMDETYIIKSGIEIKDIDIVLNALATRKALMSEFEIELTEQIKLEFADALRIFNEENTRCMEALRQFQEQLKNEFYKTKVKQKEVKFTQKAHKKYTQISSFIEGSAVDLKK